jgi:hypothetical protein
MITPARKNRKEGWKNRLLLYKKTLYCQENIGPILTQWIKVLLVFDGAIIKELGVCHKRDKSCAQPAG